jgi:hypothetical protein
VPRPAGKLALIIARLAANGGATAGELVAALVGWHSVLGALSRLRARGFERRLDAGGDRRPAVLKRRAGPCRNMIRQTTRDPPSARTTAPMLMRAWQSWLGPT